MVVVAVSRSATHTFSKQNEASIRLLAGLGVEGDAHLGATVQHLSRIPKQGETPNLRQVHLIHAELFEELAAKGFTLLPGQIGENITTRGVDLLGLPTGARMRLGDSAMVELTGLRTPCGQLDDLQSGLKEACLGWDADGNMIRKSGVMAVVIEGGEVRPGDTIRIDMPPEPHRPLEKV